MKPNLILPRKDHEKGPLGKLADKISPEELPPHSRFARRIRPALEIEGVREAISTVETIKVEDKEVSFRRLTRTKGPAISAGKGGIVTREGKAYMYCSDGSLRHAFGRVKGKAARKALKRQAQKERGYK